MTQPIVIMGANGGIGEALAKKLDQDGESLFLTARDESTIADLPGKTASLDVMDSEKITEIIESADEGEGLKGLAYCIGSIALKPLKAAKEDEFIQSYQLNVMGAIHTLKAAEKSLKKASGSVVLFSTVAVQQGFPNHALISTAKGAIEGLTRSLAAEWAPHIRVNAIAPSLSDTGIAKPLTGSEKMAEAIAGMHPIPRLGKAEDSANAAAFLLSDEASWVTGQIIHVDGGRSSLRIKG